MVLVASLPGFALSAPWQAPSPAPVDPYAHAPSPPPAPAYVAPAPSPYVPPASPALYQHRTPEPSGELMLMIDFAALGVLASATIIDTRDIDDSGVGTMLVLGGAMGGGATGWLLSNQFKATRGDGHATTLGLALGVANAGLLAAPTGLADEDEVLPLVLGASTAGAIGGFALSRQLDLTAGQAVFAANTSYLGVGTAGLFMAMLDDDDLGRDRALTALTVGLDGGALGGLLIAPHLSWSRSRAHVVSGATVVGTFVGGMMGGLLAPSSRDGAGDSDIDPRVLAGSMLIGMWGGFAGGIAATRSFTPDRRVAANGSSTTVAPLVGPGVMGASATGRW
jgi:hypothetical protein